jgi:hypothetical protein
MHYEKGNNVFFNIKEKGRKSTLTGRRAIQGLTKG